MGVHIEGIVAVQRLLLFENRNHRGTLDLNLNAMGQNNVSSLLDRANLMPFPNLVVVDPFQT